MLEILKNLFSPEQFMPHGYCYLWKPELVGLHVISDIAIALAYYSIPIALVYFVRQRRDVPFGWLFWLFGTFIAACGTTHIMEVWNLWHPAYWLAGAIKAVAAIVSCYTALELLSLIPQALALPSPAQLREANEKLAEEIKQRQRIEAALRESEQRFRAIFNQTFQLMALWQSDGIVLEANQTFFDLLGIEREESLGRALWQAPCWLKQGGTADAEVESTPIELRLKEAIAFAARGQFHRDELELVGPRNRLMTLDFSLKPLSKDENLLILEGRDITDRKRSDKLVRALNAKLEDKIRKRTTGLKRGYQALKNRIRQQQVVVELGQKALSVRDISVLMDETVALLATTLDVEYCKILELLPEKNALLLRAGVGWAEGLVGRAEVDTDINSQAGYTLKESKPIIVEDLRAETRFRGPQLLRDHDVVSGMSVTIPGKERPFGVLAVHAKEKCLFKEDDAYFLLAVANLLAAAIEREAMEAQVRSREEMFVELTENIRQVFWMTSLDKRELIYVSPTYREIWGRSPRTAYLQPQSFLLSGVHPDDLPRVKAGIEKQMRGELVSDEYRLLQPDGEVRWLVTRAFPVSDRSGKIYRTVGISEDITERKQMEMELFQEKELARITLKSIGDGVITIDKKGRVNYLNPIAEKMTGWKLAEAKGLPVTEIFRAIDEITREPLENPLIRVFQEKRIVFLDYNAILIARNGEKYSIDDSAAPICTKDGQILGAVMVFRDVTESRKMTRQLSWQAKHDALTGLANRLEFQQRLETIIANAREDNRTHVLCFLDLDRFKIVNDTCGHAAGDELLRQVTRLLKGRCRPTDFLARLGGDEFGLLLLQCNVENAKQVAEKLIESVRKFRFVWNEQTFSIGVSIGLVEVNRETIETETACFLSGDRLLNAADSACYVAKNRGRNCFHVYCPEDSAVSIRKKGSQWQGQIELAIKENRFEFYCQTLLPLAESVGVPPYYELELRMKGEGGESIPAGAFLSEAERYNLLPKLDRWTVSNLLSYLSSDANSQGGIFALPLSAASLRDQNFIDFVREQLEKYPIWPQRICFEIEEREAIANLTTIIPPIGQLAQMGCYFALDEFASSISTFAYLKSLRVDFLKIDGSLLSEIGDDRLNYAVVESINRIAHLMGLKTIAAVADGTAMEQLRILGTDYLRDSEMATPLLKPLYNAPVHSSFL